MWSSYAVRLCATSPKNRNARPDGRMDKQSETYSKVPSEALAKKCTYNFSNINWPRRICLKVLMLCDVCYIFYIANSNSLDIFNPSSLVSSCYSSNNLSRVTSAHLLAVSSGRGGQGLRGTGQGYCIRGYEIVKTGGGQSKSLHFGILKKE